MSVDLTTPQAQIAQHFMRTTKGLSVEPYEVLPLGGWQCWYFYYRLPQGILELEVHYIAGNDEWKTTVTAFPATTSPNSADSEPDRA